MIIQLVWHQTWTSCSRVREQRTVKAVPSRNPFVEEVPIRSGRRAMRHAILVMIVDRLEECCDIEVTRDAFVDDDVSLRLVDAFLSFKSDSRLDELRAALGRMEDGTYGICLCCRRPIDDERLERQPVQRVCARCKEEVWRSVRNTDPLCETVPP